MDLSHVDENGRARMVDVSAKPEQKRIAKAQGRILLAPDTVALIRANEMKKGDVLAVAELAGIQGAKRTAELIPLCHSLPLSYVRVTCLLEETGILVRSEACCTGPTGVEMEALTAVQIALLAIYDMAKAVDKTMKMLDIALISKEKRDLA